jgi:RNA polymerase subunit RPABC4/transcription elongation factor Spt4
MSSLLDQILTMPVRVVLIITVVILVLLWIFSIAWVNRDARMRDTPAALWTIVAIIPVAGLVAYCLMRPSVTRMDRDEQEMELDLLQRQLDDYGICPQCGAPTKADYVLCPQCHQRLRNVCTHCERPLEANWTICPYCTTPVAAAQPAGGDRAADIRARYQLSHSADPFEPSE